MADEEIVEAEVVEPELLEPAAEVTALAEGDALARAWDAAAGELRDATQAYAYDGERQAATPQAHQSGEPQVRSLVLGDEDPRDAALHEQIVGEDTLFSGLIFDVNRLSVKLPDGRDAARDVLRHPGAVAIVALTDDSRILLVRQYRTAIDRVTVEIPAGKLDPGEDPLECARRELAEETGARAERMAYLTTIATTVGFTDEVIHIYLATGLGFAQSNPDADEFINVDLVELSELIDAVLDGKIEDAKTIVGALACDAIAHRLQAD